MQTRTGTRFLWKIATAFFALLFIVEAVASAEDEVTADSLKEEAKHKLQGDYYRGDDLYDADGVSIEIAKPTDASRLKEVITKAGLLSGDHRLVNADVESPRNKVLFELFLFSPMHIPKAILVLKREPFVVAVAPSKKEGGNGFSVASIAQSKDFLKEGFSSKDGEKRIHEALSTILQRKSPTVKVEPIDEEEYRYQFIVNKARNLFVPGKDYWEKAKLQVVLAPTFMTPILRLHLDFDYEYAPSSTKEPSSSKYRRLALADVAPLMDFANRLADELETYFAENPAH
jgi:hypothetical protein